MSRADIKSTEPALSLLLRPPLLSSVSYDQLKSHNIGNWAGYPVSSQSSVTIRRDSLDDDPPHRMRVNSSAAGATQMGGEPSRGSEEADEGFRACDNVRVSQQRYESSDGPGKKFNLCTRKSDRRKDTVIYGDVYWQDSTKRAAPKDISRERAWEL